MNVTEVRDSDFKNAFPGIFNFTVGILPHFKNLMFYDPRMSDSGSDSEEPVYEIEVASPVNIALVKYWGKRDVSLILPFNDSISLTLDENYLGMSENLIFDWLVIIDRSVSGII